MQDYDTCSPHSVTDMENFAHGKLSAEIQETPDRTCGCVERCNLLFVIFRAPAKRLNQNCMGCSSPRSQLRIQIFAVTFRGNAFTISGYPCKKNPPLFAEPAKPRGGVSYKRLAHTKTTEVLSGSTIAWIDDLVRQKVVFSDPGEVCAPQARKFLRFESTKCILAIGNRHLGLLILKIFAAARRLPIQVDYTTAKSL